MNGPPEDRPLEAAEDPGTAHGLTLAVLIEVKRQRQRDLTAALFGARTDSDPEEDPDGE